jgi:hypothetical protein
VQLVVSRIGLSRRRFCLADGGGRRTVPRFGGVRCGAGRGVTLLGVHLRGVGAGGGSDGTAMLFLGDAQLLGELAPAGVPVVFRP